VAEWQTRQTQKLMAHFQKKKTNPVMIENQSVTFFGEIVSERK